MQPQATSFHLQQPVSPWTPLGLGVSVCPTLVRDIVPDPCVKSQGEQVSSAKGHGARGYGGCAGLPGLQQVELGKQPGRDAAAPAPVRPDPTDHLREARPDRPPPTPKATRDEVSKGLLSCCLCHGH